MHDYLKVGLLSAFMTLSVVVGFIIILPKDAQAKCDPANLGGSCGDRLGPLIPDWALPSKSTPTKTGVAPASRNRNLQPSPSSTPTTAPQVTFTPVPAGN